MSYKHKPTVIESLAEKLGVIPDLHADDKTPVAGLPSEGVAMACPPPEKWDSWVEYDSKSWPGAEGKRIYADSDRMFLTVRRDVACWLMSTKRP